MEKKLKRPSIRDVAREAGVSISTVSSVVNKTKFVKEDRQKSVLKAVKKLNYKPNIIARGLRTRSTRAVGVIVPDIAQPFFLPGHKGNGRSSKGKAVYTYIELYLL